MFGVSAPTVLRWERGNRPVPRNVVEVLERLVSEKPSDEVAVMLAVGEGGRTRSVLVAELSDPRLVAELDRLIASGKLCTALVPRTDRRGRHYAREGIFKASAAPRRGLDRMAPLATGRSLAAARKSQGLAVEELAHRIGVAPSTLRYWEATGPPRARIPMLAAALDAVPSGVQIRRARVAAKWTLGDLGRRVGVGVATVHAWESGRRPVPLGRKVLLLEALSEASDAALKRPEEMARRVELAVASSPGISKAEFRHAHRVKVQGRSRFDPEVDTALRSLLRGGRLSEGLVIKFDSHGRPRTRMCLFAPGTAPPSLPRMSGDRLGDLRVSLGWTRVQLASNLSVSPSLVGGWERRRGSFIPGYWSMRVEELGGRHPQGPTIDEQARASVLQVVEQHPGIGRKSLLVEVGHSKAARRAIAALLDDGALSLGDAWDGVGRRHLGHYVPSVVSPSQRIGAEELRDRRRRQGISATELGEIVGVRGNAVTRYETGARNCPPTRMRALLDALDARESEPAPSNS